MRSNFKPLGKYIREVDIRDAEESVGLLLGVSIQKKFIPSIANTIGTDMSTYKIIKKNQFAYGPVTSRNGDKISVALLEDVEQAIISQAYSSFEIIDTDALLPEYLMMWFRRPEFDRYARFMSHGSARELFDWEAMCNTFLPVPSITKQKEIVKEYKVIQNRIALNQQLIQKLEETAQAIYKQWFVDFEFPDENGKPYKSSGGEMVFNAELEVEIPKGWESQCIKDFAQKIRSGGTPSRDEISYWNSNDLPWLKTGEVANKVLVASEEYISTLGMQNSSAKLLPINTVLVAMYGEGRTKGQSGYLRFEAAVNQACCAITCVNEAKSSYLYYFIRLHQEIIARLANGGAQPNLSKDLIENIRILKPAEAVLKRHPFIQIINQCENNEKENIKLTELTNILLSKLATIET
jgi:type I restriction enzyme S subunit